MKSRSFWQGAALICALGLAPLLVPVALALAPSPAPEEKSAVETLAEARAALTAKEPQKAADLIAHFLSQAIGTHEIEDLYGQVLLQLGRKDEAAFHFGAALRLLGDNEAPQRAIKANLSRADALYTRRAAMLLKVSKEMLDVCQKLNDAGHTERALALLEPLDSISIGAERQKARALADKIRAANQAVDLEKGASEESDSGVRPQAHYEGAHYILEANLEPEVTRRVSDVMDDIFNYYVLIYFDGDASRVSSQKPTIRIHPTHAEMVKNWEGPPTVGGWWSPGEWTVVCYDTRTDSGNLDQMLQTLYHEASHHFMTMLSSGGSPPAWINEGTASFFEGATSMEDRRVLWPDAATDRLRALHGQLTGGRGPTPAQVVSYNDPGSYPGEYYSFGWGLVYYLQQYEDPATLEYVFRPLYAEYRDTIAKKGGDPMELFKQVFLDKKAPGGFTDFDAWAAKWREWILDQVYPLHFGGARMRDLRLDKARMYIEASWRAKNEKSAKVSEAELLSRALGHLEFIRQRIDGAEMFDIELLLMQADVLERMGRPQATAALLAQVLELVDAGEATLEIERYEELDKRLIKLDAKNQPLRLAKARAGNFAKSALVLIGTYRASETPMTLTAYGFARSLADVLENEALAEAAEELRTEAREAGLLRGALYKIGGRTSSWVTIFERSDEVFEPTEAVIAISGVRPVGRLFAGLPVSGEYELRCTLARVGDVARTSSHGVVFAGTATAQWYVCAVDGKGQLVVRRYEKGGSERTLNVVPIDPPLAPDESPALVVHVYDQNRITVQLGVRAPVEFQLDEDLPKTAHVGIFAKYGRTELRSTVLEVFP